MQNALKTDAGKARAENEQKKRVCSQLNSLFTSGELLKPKGFSKNKVSLATMKEMLLVCIRSRPPAPVSSTSSTSASAPLAPSDTESDENSDADTPLSGLTSTAASTTRASAAPTKSRPQRVYADISTFSSAPDVEEVLSGALDPDFDAVGSDSDDEASTMPCCGVKWDEDVGSAVVMCNRSCEWFHKGPLGVCPGQELTRKKLGASLFRYFCRECLASEA